MHLSHAYSDINHIFLYNNVGCISICIQEDFNQITSHYFILLMIIHMVFYVMPSPDQYGYIHTSDHGPTQPSPTSPQPSLSTPQSVHSVCPGCFCFGVKRCTSASPATSADTLPLLWYTLLFLSSHPVPISTQALSELELEVIDSPHAAFRGRPGRREPVGYCGFLNKKQRPPLS